MHTSYGEMDISDSTISRITDKILSIGREWQERPFEEVYAVVFMDAIHYHVRSQGRIVKRAVYIAIGIDMSGKKDVLGMYVGENESAKFWLSIMNGLKNRAWKIFLISTIPKRSDGSFIPRIRWKDLTVSSVKVTKSKTIFPTDDSLLKMLYLVMMDIAKKWTVHR